MNTEKKMTIDIHVLGATVYGTMLLHNRLVQNTQLTVVDGDGTITATRAPSIFPCRRLSYLIFKYYPRTEC